MDREKVIAALDCKANGNILDCKSCNYYKKSGYFKFYFCSINLLHKDVIALLKEQDAEISRISNAYLELVGKASKQPKVVRCMDCWKKGNPYLCRFDRDLEEHGSHRTEADDAWFCADGERKTACDGCENKGSEDCALGKPGSENAYCPNGKLR